MDISRRKFIRVAAFSSLGVLSVPLIMKGFDAITDANGTQVNNVVDNNFRADVDLELTALQKEVQLLDGQKTSVYSYEPRILKGGDRTVDPLADTYLGPIIRVKPGQKVRVRFKNQLPRESVIHWHGLHISPRMDGHPMYAIDQGEQFIYEFTVNNRPGTYWFHPHPDQITGPQVYYGLAGMFIVEGAYADLPSGDYDMPLIIQDRKFDGDNQLVYLENNRMARMRGFLGDRMLVNGRPEWHTRIKKATYRFRILNGSNSRIYKLAWSDGSDVIAIGTDGGLLEKPIRKPYLMLSPGERVEIWKDFSAYSVDQEVILKSLAFEPGTSMGMGGGMMGGGSPQIPNGREFDIYSFSVSSRRGPQKPLPSRLSDPGSIDVSRAVNADRPRKFNFSFERMQWVINGETFGMKEVADWEKVRLNTTEIWEFINGGGGRGMGMMGNMMQMPHPVHMHGLQFNIIERDHSGVSRSVWDTVKYGFIDEGWQDTFLLLPGMRVQVAMRFEDFTGIYVYHCHNLEHEDMGMMRNYEVVD
ncbi:MAG: multicopper oxidase family protein [Bacteroidales bacterium]|nr:multicopper oxidase family protein [Bacteroidales bacterium]